MSNASNNFNNKNNFNPLEQGHSSGSRRAFILLLTPFLIVITFLIYTISLSSQSTEIFNDYQNKKVVENKNSKDTGAKVDNNILTVENPVLTRGVNEEGENIDVVKGFTINAPRFILSMKAINAKPNTKITCRWIYTTENKLFGETEEIIEGSRYINSNLVRYDGLWPEGEYSVQIFLEDEEDPSMTVPFYVYDYLGNNLNQ